MEISSEFVGTRSRPFEIELTARQTMNFAAGTGDPNPWYFADERPEGILAPPMLAVALTWPISEGFPHYWEQQDFPAEVLTRQVHYSQHLEWFRPMRPGDRLTIQGEVRAILPHRAGTHLIIEYQATNPAGEKVFEERIGGLLRGVKCVGKGRGTDTLPAAPRPGSPDQALWEKTLRIDLLAAHVYDGCANIHFPIHSSVAFARRVGLPGTIYQGTATLSLAVRELINAEAAGDPRRLDALSCLFTGMVLPGSEIRLCMTGRESVAGQTDLYFMVLNEEGKTAIRDGRLRLHS